MDNALTSITFEGVTGCDTGLIGQFLCSLANDIARRPELLQFADPGLAQRLHSLVGAVHVDLDTALLADNE